ncbi:MAG: HypC/HybG/HupF family hydrogenase formation chaperone [Caldithrix sp.]|nr:HypC/HybG/HupF family hydrogenase formation chaperone [Caldithrix sp.]
MCLAIPGKVIEIYEENGLTMGKIDYSGSQSTACLAYVPEAKTGQYVVVHAGFAISIMDEEEAQKVFEAWDEVTDAAREQGYNVTNEPLAEKNKRRS